jgi:imidazolonepropionase
MAADADLVVTCARLVATCAGPAPRRGTAQRQIGALADAAIAACDGHIVYVGPAADLPAHVHLHHDAVRVDAGGGLVVPGFVDPHTHAVYAGDRRDELRQRIDGATYEAVAAAGGGIASTVAATRTASVDALVTAARPRLNTMLACGTTTCEIKSGYGLTTDAEVAQLRAIAALDAAHPVDTVATFLGAHDLPPEYRWDRTGYVTLVKDEMVPRVAQERLATWCDVFCERGVFRPDEALDILQAGSRAGLRPRVHADELSASGGAYVAVAAGARSADHLVFVEAAGVRALADAGVCAVLLPSAAFYLKLGRYAPARSLIDTGVPVALGTDRNPGGGLSPSMPFAMALACFAMDMTLEEALVAATLNAAWSLDLDDRVGSLEPGKQMDAVVIDGDLIDLLRVGISAIRIVIKQGRVVIPSAAVPGDP